MELRRRSRLTIYLSNADTHHHRAMSAEILHRAHKAGIAGATTLQGVEGYGHSTTIHATPKWRLTDHSPVTIHLIDESAALDRFVPLLADMADRCLIIRDDVLTPDPG